jgi:hypothetical protein
VIIPVKIFEKLIKRNIFGKVSGDRNGDSEAA